jgi:ankyrin repeat protein
MSHRRSALEFLDHVLWSKEKIHEAAEAQADFNARGADGMTALMWACMFCTDTDIVTALLRAGADKDAKDDFGFTPLMLAVDFNHNPAVILALLNAGANADARDRSGRTAFDNARARARFQGPQDYRGPARTVFQQEILEMSS